MPRMGRAVPRARVFLTGWSEAILNPRIGIADMFSPGPGTNDSIVQPISKPATSVLNTRPPPAASSAV
jgi:hypothetical protein